MLNLNIIRNKSKYLFDIIRLSNYIWIELKIYIL